MGMATAFSLWKDHGKKEKEQKGQTNIKEGKQEKAIQKVFFTTTKQKKITTKERNGKKWQHLKKGRTTAADFF